jgi:hypothetical protein
MKTIILFGENVSAELHPHLKEVYADKTLTRTSIVNSWQLETASAIYDVANCRLPAGASLVEIEWLQQDETKRRRATFNARIRYADPTGEGFGQTLARIIERMKISQTPKAAGSRNYTHKEFMALAQAKHKDLAKVWMALAGDDVVAHDAAILWVKLQSWREVALKLRKKNGKPYSPEGARRAAHRFYDVVAGPGIITSDESLRDYYTREGNIAQRKHGDDLRAEVDAELTQS